MRLSEILEGQKARITGFNNDRVQEKLMEMGCVPGVDIERVFAAPWGDPVAFNISGYVLSMRQEEAETIDIELI